ncbi:MAG TPA: hypothetical protein VGO00_24225, partial [Kofleriaceae bacterium]|nr:hypothetical protein [Kofleriaceae bacterium]
IAAYQLDFADVAPSAVGGFTPDVSELRWHDDGSRPANFAVGQGEGWTLIAPIEYHDTDAVLRVPTLPGRDDTPTFPFITAFTDGETYDAVRPHAAEYWLGFLSETDGSGSRLSGKSTPSRRIVAQFINNCEFTQDCE